MSANVFLFVRMSLNKTMHFLEKKGEEREKKQDLSIFSFHVVFSNVIREKNISTYSCIYLFILKKTLLTIHFLFRIIEYFKYYSKLYLFPIFSNAKNDTICHSNELLPKSRKNLNRWNNPFINQVTKHFSCLARDFTHLWKSLHQEIKNRVFHQVFFLFLRMS